MPRLHGLGRRLREPWLGSWGQLLPLLAGVAAGLWLTERTLTIAHSPVSERIGPWSVWRSAGLVTADPYARALTARRGDLPMTPADGLVFHALSDDAGAALDRRCTYRLEGPAPPARAWTLATHDPSGAPLPVPEGRHHLTALAVTPNRGDPLAITLGPDVQPGHWLPLAGAGRFSLTFRLYETPLASQSLSLDRLVLPGIRRLGCA